MVACETLRTTGSPGLAEVARRDLAPVKICALIGRYPVLQHPKGVWRRTTDGFCDFFPRLILHGIHYFLCFP